MPYAYYRDPHIVLNSFCCVEVCAFTAGTGSSSSRVLCPGGCLQGLQWLLDGWCVSANCRAQWFPQEHCIGKESMLITVGGQCILLMQNGK